MKITNLFFFLCFLITNPIPANLKKRLTVQKVLLHFFLRTNFKVILFNIRDAFNKFPDFFVQVFKIVVYSWKLYMLLLYILWDDWPIFLISGTNEQVQQELEYTLLKPDCHSWWISKMQSGLWKNNMQWDSVLNLAKMPCDESWIYCYDSETKRQSSQWKHAGSPRPKKARQSKSTHKLLMIPSFLTALPWSTCTGFPLDRQSTRNTMLRF